MDNIQPLSNSDCAILKKYLKQVVNLPPNFDKYLYANAETFNAIENRYEVKGILKLLKNESESHELKKTAILIDILIALLDDDISRRAAEF